MPVAAQRGFELFRGRAGCAQCHRVDGTPSTFTDDAYHRVGVGLNRIAPKLATLTAQVATLSLAQLEVRISEDDDVAALGRYLVTRDPKDIGKYRTPSLRNVARTAPYMHDGSLATLRDVVDYEVYYRSVTSDRPLVLTPAEKDDLLNFLEMLTVAPIVTSNSRVAPIHAGGTHDR